MQLFPRRGAGDTGAEFVPKTFHRSPGLGAWLGMSARVRWAFIQQCCKPRKYPQYDQGQAKRFLVAVLLVRRANFPQGDLRNFTVAQFSQVCLDCWSTGSPDSAQGRPSQSLLSYLPLLPALLGGLTYRGQWYWKDSNGYNRSNMTDALYLHNTEQPLLSTEYGGG